MYTHAAEMDDAKILAEDAAPSVNGGLQKMSFVVYIGYPLLMS